MIDVCSLARIVDSGAGYHLEESLVSLTIPDKKKTDVQRCPRTSSGDPRRQPNATRIPIRHLASASSLAGAVRQLIASTCPTPLSHRFKAASQRRKLGYTGMPIGAGSENRVHYMGSLLRFSTGNSQIKGQHITENWSCIPQKVQMYPSHVCSQPISASERISFGRAHICNSETSVVSLLGAGRIRVRSASPRKATLLKRVHLNNTTRHFHKVSRPCR